ncbi:hypothetical protein OC835_004694 [Tilletia horrida]|nr:hypothetical protein OC835_004694 [Tilletia horrida]
MQKDAAPLSSQPRSHTDRLCVWAVDISGWADSLPCSAGTSSSSSPTSAAGSRRSSRSASPRSGSGAGSASSSRRASPDIIDPTRRGRGTPVDKIVEELLGSHGELPVSEDMGRASTKIRRYLREVDRVRSLAGQLLPRVMYMQKYPNHCTWSNMHFDATKEKRPFLAEPTLPEPSDYNLSHDEDWVALAFHDPLHCNHQAQHIPTASHSLSSRLDYSRASPDSETSSDKDSLDSNAYATPRSSPATSIRGHASGPAPSAGQPTNTPALRVGIDVMAVALPHYDPTVAGFVSMMELAMTPGEKEWVFAAAAGQSSSLQPGGGGGGGGGSALSNDYFDQPPRSQHASRKHGAPPTPAPEELLPADHEMLMRLYDLWTYKEAFTKNVGRGLGFDFSTIEVGLWRCASVPLPSSAEEAKGEEHRIVRAARQHASRISALPSPSPSSGYASSAEPILTLAGVPEDRYSFVEIHLPASTSHIHDLQPKQQDGPHSSSSSSSSLSSTTQMPTHTRPRSQLVICEGPHPSSSSRGTATSSQNDASSASPKDTQGLVQVAPALDAAEAVQMGLLRVWTMEELVQEARRLRCLG